MLFFFSILVTKHLEKILKAFQFQRVSLWPSLLGTLWLTGRHGAVIIAESSHVIHKHKSERKLTGNGASFWDLKAQHQWHTSPNKDLLILPK